MKRDGGSISFPRDSAAHPSSNLEWWYCYAFLTGSRGNRYAWMASFFRVGELPVLKGHYMIYSLIRLDGKKSENGSSVDRTLALQLAGLYLPLYLLTNRKLPNLLKGVLSPPPLVMDQVSVESHPTRLVYGSSEWSFTDDLTSNFHLRTTCKTAQVDLSFRPVKPASIIDDEGTLNGLLYYSATRNEVSGEMTDRETGLTETLSGEGWFDHQWGRHYGLLQGGGWDWFGLQLEDGRELLINQLRPAGSAPEASPVAKAIGKDGAVTTTERVILKPLAYWKSLYTGAKYPVEWEISLPDLGMLLHAAPLQNNQEIPIIGPIKAIWEGACTITGVVHTPDGKRSPIKGKGFIELVGYAR